MRAAWRSALPGTSALFLGIGLGRFSYAPFIPALVAAGWVTTEGAGYLGAGNLAGYVLGAALAPWLREPRAGLRAAMATVALGFAASAVDLGDLWLLLWRVLLGVAGGVCMGLAGPILLAATPPERRGALTGLIYAGVGLGAVASGVIVPPLLGFGLEAAWLGVALVAAVAVMVGWSGWPEPPPAPPRAALGFPPRAVLVVAGAYALYGAAGVPHSLFLVDHVARELGRGLAEGGAFWFTLGVGALAGPPLAGLLADRVGFVRATLVGYVALAAATALPALSESRPALTTSAAVVGACLPGIAGLVGGRLIELVGAVEQRRWWPPLVVIFALAQAAGGYAFTWLASATGSYRPGFAVAGALAAIGAALLAAPTRPSQPSRSTS